MATTRQLLRPAIDTRLGRRAQQQIFPAMYFGRALETFDRPAWLYRAHGAIPALDILFREALPVGPQDVALCERLIQAYALALEEAPPTDGLWAHEDFQRRQRKLLGPLADRDAEGLAGCLASMFQSDFVLGMAGGSLGARHSRVSRKLWSYFILNKLVGLAESLGTARAENPEQGDVGIAFAGGIERLVADTEAELGVSLNFPDVGAAYGIAVEQRLITADSLDQIYAAARIRDAARTYLSDRQGTLSAVEIGGGFGAMAFWLLQMLQLNYTIVDLPLVNVLQGYFHGEQPRQVAILPTHALAGIPQPFDMLLNKDSMPEIPRDAVLAYLTWGRYSCDGLFYSYNQEAAAVTDGAAQNVVPELIAEIGGFHKLRREHSWLRRGYAEEIYAVTG
jgi:hypothetical protein